MIQISTSTGNLPNYIQKECTVEGLNEDDESFYKSIHGSLNELVREPQSATIEFILKFSRSI